MRYVGQIWTVSLSTDCGVVGQIIAHIPNLGKYADTGQTAFLICIFGLGVTLSNSSHMQKFHPNRPIRDGSSYEGSNFGPMHFSGKIAAIVVSPVSFGLRMRFRCRLKDLDEY